MSDSQTLKEARKSLKIKWYRTKLDIAVLREMNERSDAKGLFQALGHLVLYIAAGLLTYWLWSQRFWVGFACALLVHGIVASFLRGTATHELNHGTVFKSKGLNTFFLNLFSLLSWWNHEDYKASHKYHHIYTLYPEADRENVLPLKPLPDFFSFIQLCTLNLFTRAGRTFGSGGFFAIVLRYLQTAFRLPSRSLAPSVDWLEALHKDDPDLARRSVRWARTMLLFHAAIIVVSILTGLWVLPLIITLGSFTTSIFSYVVGIAQHSGMKDRDPDFRKVARSMTLGPILTFLYWHMNWHCEHHMYAAVPCYNLRKLAKHIEYDLPKPLGLFATWKEMLDIRKHQQQDPSYVFERPLPPTAMQA